VLHLFLAQVQKNTDAVARLTSEVMKLQATVFDLRAAILGSNSAYLITCLPLKTKEDVDTFDSLLEAAENISAFVS
jgi:hypothetical protein